MKERKLCVDRSDGVGWCAEEGGREGGGLSCKKWADDVHVRCRKHMERKQFVGSLNILLRLVNSFLFAFVLGGWVFLSTLLALSLIHI